MKKVLIDLNKLSNLNCGLGQVALNFGRAISEAETDIKISFLVPQDFIGYFGDSVEYYTSKSISSLKNSFDLWHSIHQEPIILPEDNTDLLVTIHDLNFLGEKSDKKASKRLKKLQSIINRTVRLAFISKYSRKHALENLNYDKNRTDVIYNGVTTSEEATAPTTKPDKFFFTIGVFKRKKNFHVLLPVMKHFPKHKLIIAGDAKGPYYKELIKTAKELGVDNQIVFPGIISEQEKTWYYRNCNAFLFPSLHEGFGLPVIEAMQNGAPIITSSKTSLPEVGGNYSFIFKDFNEDTIKKEIEKGINRHLNEQDFKKSSINYALQFSWKENVEKYLELYKVLLQD